MKIKIISEGTQKSLFLIHIPRFNKILFLDLLPHMTSSLFEPAVHEQQAQMQEEVGTNAKRLKDQDIWHQMFCKLCFKLVAIKKSDSDNFVLTCLSIEVCITPSYIKESMNKV